MQFVHTLVVVWLAGGSLMLTNQVVCCFVSFVGTTRRSCVSCQYRHPHYRWFRPQQRNGHITATVCCDLIMTSALEALDDCRDKKGTTESSKIRLHWIDPATTAGANHRDNSDMKNNDDTMTTTTCGAMDNLYYDSTTNTNSDNDNDIRLRNMPLYPIPAVYLPNTMGETRLINNIERRNIQMILDCGGVGGCFCTVLKVLDTGRIATVGTLLRIVHMDIQTIHPIPPTTTTTSTTTTTTPSLNQIQRIVVTCQPESIVDILYIENPVACTMEYRLQHPNEYLRGTVCVRRPINNDMDIMNTKNMTNIQCLCDRLYTDYNVVRQYYWNGVGMIDNTMPPISNIELSKALPMVQSSQEFVHNFWKMANIWQTLCETVFATRQRILNADRNEMLVDAAIRKGGALQLPIHLDDITSTIDRQNIQRMEELAQELWQDLRLDPCIDFQKLLVASSLSSSSTTNTNNQQQLEESLNHFANMISRERFRLEELQSVQQTSSLATTDQLGHESTSLPIQPMIDTSGHRRKGAWFEDDW